MSERGEQQRGDLAVCGADERKVPVAFGPVPSRRLWRSVGISNIPPKVCSYSCVYCQVGATPSPQLEPRTIYPPEELAARVRGGMTRAGGSVESCSRESGSVTRRDRVPAGVDRSRTNTCGELGA